MMNILLIYVIGFFATLIFFIIFGKLIDFTYTNNDDEDDFDDNPTAYIFFSIFWFVVVPMLLISGLWILLVYFTRFLYSISEKINRCFKRKESSSLICLNRKNFKFGK